MHILESGEAGLGGILLFNYNPPHDSSIVDGNYEGLRTASTEKL